MAKTIILAALLVLTACADAALFGARERDLACGWSDAVAYRQQAMLEEKAAEAVAVYNGTGQPSGRDFDAEIEARTRC